MPDPDDAVDGSRASSAWTDLDRPPLSAARLRAALRDDPVWCDVRVVPVTRSTNADVSAAAGEGAPQGLVVVAEEQRGGRGRLDRRWESPPRAGILLSALLRPAAPIQTWTTIPLLTGVAVVEAVRSVAGLPAVLKWPNDVLVHGRKLGGVLVERVGEDAVVIGLGLNVSTRRSELPVETATSVALEGGSADREPLVKELLRSLSRRYRAFEAVGGSPDAVLPAYREVCETIGRQVAVHAGGGEPDRGVAVAVDDAGLLVVRDSDGAERTWSAGDVVHVRAEG